MEQSWISGADFREELAKADPPITPDQIERWRREGLLPHPRQIGHGRGKGSHSEVPQVSVRQAQEIARLYALRRKRDWVGWQLWLRGFDVAERYWREPLENARNAIIDTQQAARAYDRSALAAKIDPDTLKSRVLPAVRNTPLYAPLAKIRAEYVETLGGFLIDIVLGRFAGFSREGNSRPNRKERDAVLAVMGANTAASRRIADFSGLIESVLQDIAKAFRTIARRDSLTEPSVEARHEFLAAMEIGTSLYWITKVILRPKALGTFNRMAADREITMHAVMLLGWAEYRNISNTILPFSKIDQMRNLVLPMASEIRRLTTKI